MNREWNGVVGWAGSAHAIGLENIKSRTGRAGDKFGR